MASLLLRPRQPKLFQRLRNRSSQPPAQTRLSLETANQTIIDDIPGNAERIAQHPAQTTQQTEVVQFVMDTDIAPVSQEAAPTRARRSVKKTEKVRNTQLPETTEEARPIRPLRRSRGIAVAPTALPEPAAPPSKTRSRTKPAVQAAVKPIEPDVPEEAKPALKRGRKTVAKEPQVEPVKTTRKRALPVEVEAIAELEEPVRQTRSRKTTSVVERGDNRPSPAKKARSSKMATTDEPLGPSQAKPKAATRKGAVAATASAFDKENSPAPIRMTRSRATRSAAAPEPAALAVRATRSRAARK
ncbi:hypothetical protein CALVIDRAFT_404101 [Calocera viscosa TUFC12733]|uniref:Uncharacterized protein n=1 Tax=Calocera viscosa (strain TUFC12733) TaxID=1330018 RepID=A0A167PVB5_CALVF|nr:hypothetical protein CALVIDRAFT_404101 [Calocera viscosa TUFC12733]